MSLRLTPEQILAVELAVEKDNSGWWHTPASTALAKKRAVADAATEHAVAEIERRINQLGVYGDIIGMLTQIKQEAGIEEVKP